MTNRHMHRKRTFTLTNPPKFLWLPTWRQLRGGITAQQIAGLKHYINSAPQGSEHAKQLLFLMLDLSKGLTKKIQFTLSPENGYSNQTERDGHVRTIDNMVTAGFPTKLNAVLAATGSQFYIRVSRSDTCATAGLYDSEHSWRTSLEIAPLRSRVEEVNLQDTGLYSRPAGKSEHQTPYHLIPENV